MHIHRSCALAAAVALYLDDCLSRGQSPLTIANKSWILDGFVRWCAREEVTCVHQLRASVLEAYRRSLVTHRSALDASLAPGTIRNRLTAVLLLCQALYRRRLIRTDPTADFVLPRLPRRLPRGILSVREIEVICTQSQRQGLRGIRDRALVEVLSQGDEPTR